MVSSSRPAKNEGIGAGIKELGTLRIKEPNGTYRTVREQISYGVLDPYCFARPALEDEGEADLMSAARGS